MNTKVNKKRMLLVSSAGGHLAQLLQMKELFVKHDYLIVTEKLESTTPLQRDFNVSFIPPMSGGHNIGFWIIFLLNLLKALWLNIIFRPDVLISTGSHTAVPYFLISKVFRVNCIYILSYARVNSKAKSADLLYRISDLFIVQWKGALKYYKNAKYLGGGLY